MKSPAQLASDKRLERMMEAKRDLSLAALDTIAAQRQKVKCNMLEVYGLPRDVREYMAHIDIVLETAILWAIADGLVQVNLDMCPTREEREARLNEERKSKDKSTNVVPIRPADTGISPSAYL